jgi:catechol 2,3-dioxygenase-like lactoylglutathione lyase family enzyme
VIDHVGLGVSDLEQSKVFYQQALGPLSYQLLMERDGSVGLGRNGKPDFWIHANRPLSGPTHVPIASSDRATVHASMPRGWRLVAATTARPACAPTTTKTTTAPSSWIRTATTSRPCATGRHSAALPPRHHPAVAVLRAGSETTGTGNRPQPAVTVGIDPCRILHLKPRTVNLAPVTRLLVGKRLTLLSVRSASESRRTVPRWRPRTRCGT